MQLYELPRQEISVLVYYGIIVGYGISYYIMYLYLVSPGWKNQAPNGRYFQKYLLKLMMELAHVFSEEIN